MVIVLVHFGLVVYDLNMEEQFICICFEDLGWWLLVACGLIRLQPVRWMELRELHLTRNL